MNKLEKNVDNCEFLENEIKKCKEDFENQIKEKIEMHERRTKELESHVCKYSHVYAHNKEVKARLQEDIIRSQESLETVIGAYKRECETSKREKIELQQKWDESRRSMMADLERCRRECNHQKKEKMKLQSTLDKLDLKTMFDSFTPNSAKYIDEKSFNEKTAHDLEAELRCSVCLEHMKDPHILPSCCHRFCKSCITNSMDMSGRSCPLCRTEISDEPKPDNLAKIITDTDLCGTSSDDYDEGECEDECKVQ